MSRACSRGWWRLAVLGFALGAAALTIEAQETEPGSSSQFPQRSSRPRREGTGGFPARVTGDAAGEAPSDRDRERVDTSHNQNLVYRVQHVPAAALATSVDRNFRGVPGLILVPEATSNSLLVSAPEQKFEDVMKIIRQLDRASRSVCVEVTILDLPAVDDGNDIPPKALSGSASQVQKKIAEFKRSGQVQRVRRFRLTALDHQSTSLQAGVSRSAPAGMVPQPGGGFAPGGRGGNNSGFPGVGTNIQCTSRVAPDGGKILLELSIHDTPANRDGQSGSDVIPAQFQGTLSLTTGMTQVAADIATETENGASRVMILVAAEELSPPTE